jgi:hypothetical protein
MKDGTALIIRAVRSSSVLIAADHGFTQVAAGHDATRRDAARR